MVCLLSMALTGCVIVHHDEVGQEETLSYAEQYARDIWESEFIPYLEENAVDIDRKSTRLNSSHSAKSRMPSSA